MEVYTLDGLYRRENVIDKFESLIWTERFSTFGDFQLTLPSTLESRRLLASGTRLAMNESYRVMTVETTENKIAADGTALYTVKGRSLEMVLEERAARETLSDLTTESKWILTGLPAAIAREVFDHVIRDGSLSLDDKIALLQPGSIFPASTIPEPTDSITVELPPMSVYSAVKQILDAYNMGFRLVRNFDMSQLYFDIYAGSDRTSGQTTLPVVIFSPDLDNLQNTTELTTTAAYKNCAYVISKVGHEIVFAPGVDPTVAGFERKVLLVLAEDIEDTDPLVASARMIKRGEDALSQNRRFTAFDGELNQNAQYKYGVDYNLGDLVEMRNSDGVTNNMQVTEQIFVSDREGERSYPTLSLNQFITPGSWLAWDFNQVWDDFTVEEWDDLP